MAKSPAMPSGVPLRQLMGAILKTAERPASGPDKGHAGKVGGASNAKVARSAKSSNPPPTKGSQKGTARFVKGPLGEGC